MTFTKFLHNHSKSACNRHPLLAKNEYSKPRIEEEGLREEYYLDVSDEIVLHWTQCIDTDHICLGQYETGFPEIEIGSEPKSVVKASAASKKSLVEIALSLAASTCTSTKDFFKVSSHEPLGGMTIADMAMYEGRR